MFTFDELKKQLGWKQKLAIGVLAYWTRGQLMTGVLTGWRTKSGGLGLIISGAAAVLIVVAKSLSAFAAGRLDEAYADLASENFQIGITSITLGLGILGIGGKIERQATGELKQEVLMAEKSAKG